MEVLETNKILITFLLLIFTVISAKPQETLVCVHEPYSPFQDGAEYDCCPELKKCKKAWNHPGRFFWKCVPCSENGCRSAGECIEEPILKKRNYKTDPKPSKRGLAYKRKTIVSLEALKDTISWGYTWGTTPIKGTTTRDWKKMGIDYIPMIWGEKILNKTKAVPFEATTLLGFNEPDHPEQSNMTPERAAELWSTVEKLAFNSKVRVLVSPAMTETKQGFKWLKEFFELCNGCKIDYIALHSYVCHVLWLKKKLDLFSKEFIPKYAKGIWLTEYTCDDQNERATKEGQIAFLKETIPYLEARDDIVRYAWFGHENHNAQVYDHDTGELTDLGKLYRDLAGKIDGVDVTTLDVLADNSTKFHNFTGTTVEAGVKFYIFLNEHKSHIVLLSACIIIICIITTILMLCKCFGKEEIKNGYVRIQN